MGGFLAALGGAGQAASHYGEQMRSMLEARRKELAESIGAQAASESDPQTRVAMYQHQADLLSGKPMGGIMQKFMGTVQKRQADADTLHQAIGSPQNPQPAELPPGPAMPGSMPGKSVVMMPDQQQAPPPQGLGGFMDMLMKEGQGQQGQGSPAPPVAAQVNSNPIAGAQGPIKAPTPPQQAPALTPPPQPMGTGYPTPEDPTAIMNSVYNDPRWAAPVNRPLLLAGAQQRLSHQEALRQTLDTQQATLAMKQAAISRMKQSGSWDSLPPMLQQAYEAEAGGLAAVNSGAMWTPHILAPQVNGKGVPEGQLDGAGQPVDRSGNSDYRKVQYPGSTTPVYELLPPKTVMTDLADGTRGLNNRNTGGSLGPVEGAVAGSQIAPHLITLPSGRMAFSTVADAEAGKSPIQTGGVNVGMMPTTRDTVQDINGQKTVIPLTTRRGGVGGGQGSGPAPTISPAPAPASAPAPAGGSPTPALPQVPGHVLGASQSTFNKQIENPLDARSRGVIEDTQPTLDMIQRIKHLLETEKDSSGKPLKDSDTPLTTFWPSLKYKLGFNGPLNELISQAEISKITGSARVLKGASRSVQALNRAGVHLPTTLTDAGGKMYGQLSVVEQNLKDIIKAANEEGKKYPGLTPLPGTGGSGTGNSTVDDLLRQYGK